MSWTADTPTRSTNRIDPGPAWTVVTDAPLKGFALAREANRLLAWDDVGHVYLFDARGEFLSVERAPGPILAGAFSDDGSLIALLGEKSRLWLLGADLEIQTEREAITDASALAVDPHGRYVAVASKLNLVQFYNRHGKVAGRFETRQHLSHMTFIPAAPFLIAVGALGSISCYELSESSPGKIGGELAWTEQIMSGVGRLATTGDGGLLLLGCYTHGIQRFNLRGQNEGAYHLGGSASLVAVDFGGRTMAVATQEGDLAILGGTGHVKWRTTLPRPAIALEIDPLGLSLTYGLATGEITRLDFQAGANGSSPVAPSTPTHARSGAGSVRSPEWSVPVASSDEEAEFCVLAICDDPPRVGLMTQRNRLELFTTAGKKLGVAPEIGGVGRIVRTCPGWIVAATDRMIVACDLVKNAAHRIDLSLAEMTHLAVLPDSFGLAIVQERDRIGRATIAGRWIWKAELNVPVEDVAIGPDGHSAYTTEDGRLRIFDAGGTAVGDSRLKSGDPLLLAQAPIGSPAGLTWITLARREGVIRGHRLRGEIAWEAPVPWDSWTLHPIGASVVVTAADGRSIAFDGSGQPKGQGGKSEGALDLFTEGTGGEPTRISRSGSHLIASALDGRPVWRSYSDATIGPMAVGRPGVAVILGRSLGFFAATSPAPAVEPSR